MSEGKVVQKTEVPATIDSLQTDFRVWHQIGNGIVGSFIFECDGLGVGWGGGGHHRTSGGFRRNWHTCYAHSLD